MFHKECVEGRKLVGAYLEVIRLPELIAHAPYCGRYCRTDEAHLSRLESSCLPPQRKPGGLQAGIERDNERKRGPQPVTAIFEALATLVLFFASNDKGVKKLSL